MSIWSYLWPFGRKAAKPDPLIPAPGTHVPPSDFLGAYPEKPPAPPMQSRSSGLYQRPDRRPLEQSRIVPRRHGGTGLGDNSGDIADAAVTLITTIADTVPAPAPAPEPRHTPVESQPHHTPSHHSSHYDSGPTHAPTHHHVDTPHHVDTSPSFSDGGGSVSVSTGC